MNLHEADEIIRERCPNGWTAKRGIGAHGPSKHFAFESTESLAKQLVLLLGQSGWKIAPARDKDGKFAKAALQFEV